MVIIIIIYIIHNYFIHNLFSLCHSFSGNIQLTSSVDAIEGTDMTVSFTAFLILNNSATLDTTITIGIEHDSGDTAGT